MSNGFQGFPHLLQEQRATDYSALGKAGATAGAGLAGGTTSGAPSSGSFNAGDFVVDQTGQVWVCTAAGSPGTWVAVGPTRVGALAALADPTAFPTVSATTPTPATALAAGTYRVGYCYTTAGGGRTKLSPTMPITITAGQGIQAVAPALPVGAVGVEFYIDDCGPTRGNSWSGGATAGSFSAQSWSGGVVAGSFSAQSWSGGASVAGLTWGYPRAHLGTCTRTMGFLKAPSAPASDMIIFDWDLSASGYFRLKLNSTLHLILECNVTGFSGSVDINGGVALTANVWAWLEIYPTSPSGDGNWHARGHVTQAGTGNAGQVGNFTVGGGANFSGRLGIGTTTTSGYLAFPNSAGWEMSKVQVISIDSNNGDTGAPSSDAGGGSALYLARQATGSAVSLTDGSGSGNDAAAGSQGLTINLDGPYP